MKKATAVLLLLAMLLCLLPQDRAEAAADYSWIKVKLSTNNATSIAMYVSGQYFIKENGAAFTGGTVTVRSNFDGTMTLSHSSQGDLYTGASMSVMRANVDRTAGYMKLNGYCYLGHFNLKYMSSGYIRVVNEVPLAQYLYGVVGYEMSNTFPLEALKAQAIAAKCYVLTKMSTSGDYYIGDTSSEQVYKGYNAAYTNVISAVDSTLGEVLTVNNMLLCTYFAASNGGETMLPSQAWPSKNYSDAGYGIALDPYDLANAYSKTEVIKIPVGTSGTISSALMTFLGVKATAALGYSVNQLNSINSVTMSSPKYSSLARNMTQCTINMTVSQSGLEPATVNVTFNVSELYSYGVVRDSTLRIYWGEMTSTGYYHIYHARYGHGVGLSQRGAQAMANSGIGYRDILNFYYPGASFGTISVTAPTNPTNNASLTSPTGTYVEAVTTGNVRLRSGAGQSYGTLGTVPTGTAVYAYQSVNGWAYVNAGGSNGYISEKYLSYPSGTPAPSAAPQTTALPVATNAPAGVIAYGSVNGGEVNFRIGPGTGYQSIGKLARGTELAIYELANGWYRARTSNGAEGYMLSTYVSITGYPAAPSDSDLEQEVTETPTPTPSAAISEPTVVAYGVVTGSGVNFRSGPSTSYGSLVKLAKNTQLDIYGQSGSWYYGEADSVIGYISGGYVQITGAPAPMPVQTPAPLTTTPGSGINLSATPTPAFNLSATPTPAFNLSATPTPAVTAPPFISMLPTPTPAPSGTTVNAGKITTSGVNMRIGPGTSYAAIKKLPKDTGVYVLGSNGDWYNVQAGGVKGYVYRTYVSITGKVVMDAAAAEGATGKGVTTGKVRLRSGAGLNYDIVSTLKSGTALTLYGQTSGWYSAKLADGTKGYVSSKYVKVTEANANVDLSAGAAETTQSMGEGKTTTNVNLRQSRSTSSSSKKLAVVPAGRTVTLYSLTDGWYEAEYNGMRGYMFAKYISVTSAIKPAATTANTAGGIVSDADATVAQGSAVTLTKGVTTGKVNFRSGPDKSYSSYEMLSKGTSVQILGQTGTWYYVIAGSKTGFISTAYVSIASTGSVAIQAVSADIKPQSCKTTAEVNFRAGPATSYAKLTTLNKGTPLTVYYVTNSWCFANCGGTLGFVKDDYVALS